MTAIHINKCPVCESEDFSQPLCCKDNLVSKAVFQVYCCNNCHFGFTQDFPSENEIGKYYEAEEYVSHTDTDKGIINILYHWARKISLNSKSKLVSVYLTGGNKNILDIGAGTGYFLDRMKREGWNVEGVEKSQAARIYAKNKFGLDLHDSNALFDIPSGSMSIVTMWHVLEHIEKFKETLIRIKEILNDEGTAVIALPNKDSYDAKHYRENWAAYDVPRHLWHFSPDDFSSLVSHYGFKVVEMRPMYFDAFYISMLSEKNKGTALGSMIGLMKGGSFFLGSLGNIKKCSSVIYLLKKNKNNQL